jgi:hypothetical protein
VAAYDNRVLVDDATKNRRRTRHCHRAGDDVLRVVNVRKARRRPFRTLSAPVEPTREHHQPAWHEPVRLAVNKVDVERMAQERQNREREALPAVRVSGRESFYHA